MTCNAVLLPAVAPFVEVAAVAFRVMSVAVFINDNDGEGSAGMVCRSISGRRRRLGWGNGVVLGT